MEITAAMVKELRSQSGAGIMECKSALKETSGDVEAAITFLRKKGLAKADKKSGRQTGDGSVGTYIHAGNKLGVMVELNCDCLLYTSPSPRDATLSRMPSSA